MSAVQPHLHDAPTRLTVGDEGKLEKYFTVWQCVFEGSTTGMILERADLFSHALDLDDWDGRSEMPEPERIRPLPDRDPRKRGRQHASEPWGDGEEALTAQPTGLQHGSSRAGPPDTIVSKYAEVSGQLSAACRYFSEARAVLEAYYGDRGARYGGTDLGGKVGRLFALYPLTEAGQEILRREQGERASRAKKGDAVVDIAPHLRLENEVALERGTGSKAWRRRLLSVAEIEARKLLARASWAWNLAGVG